MGKVVRKVKPFTWRDRLYMDPFEAQTAVVGIITGALALVSLFMDHPLVQERPWTSHLLVGILGAAIVVGGVAILRGMFDHSDNVMRGWWIERTGLILSGTAWAVYGLWALALEPTTILGWLSSLLLATAMAVQYRSTVEDERELRERLGEDR